MWKNYLKTAFRNLLKQKFYAIINILGLAVGITCCLLIVLFVVDEISFDKFHEKSDRIYRIGAHLTIGEMDGRVAVVSAPMAQAMITDFPEVENATRFRMRGSYLIKHKESGSENVKENGFVFSDPQIFDIFTVKFLEGDKNTALKEPNTLVLTKSKADKFFPNGGALNQILTLDNRWDYKIVGVIEDWPANSHFRQDYLLAMEGLDESKQPIWVSHNFNTYILLKEGADPAGLEAKFPGMVEKYVGPQIKSFMNVDMKDFEKSGNRISFFLQPLTDIHLKSDLDVDFSPNSDIVYVWIFSAIAIIILLIASINFMNLSTARSANRAKEVGVRKVLGSVRGNLISQFLVESILITFIAFVVAVILAEAFLPAFNQISGKSLVLPLNSPWMILSLLLGILLVGGLSGMYPAFFLSSFEPIFVLKGKLSAGSGSTLLRSTLVVVQFIASIVLIISTVLIYQQMNFVQNKKLGFDKEQVLVIDDTYSLGDKITTFKEELIKRPDVKTATISSFLPVENTDRNNTVFWPEGKQTEDNQVLMQRWNVDFDYIPTLAMKMADGRAFSREFSTDSMAMIINETAVKNFGFENPIGQRISTFDDFDDLLQQPVAATYTVVGVVEDFHFESLRQNVSALCLTIGKSPGFISVRVNTENLAETIAGIEKTWKEFGPGQPFNYAFLDDRFNEMYKAEQRMSSIMTAFTLLAILVACLGLFALAAFMAEQRTREIGIRKVLGAEIRHIVLLLSRDFLKLIAISFVISLPIAIYGMHLWLRDYANHIDLKTVAPWAAMIAAGITLLITFISVSSQSLKAALANPVDSLRNE
ncbi:MAG: ABC transporter permease [Bacteroidia bacterium]|nr:ABC transporter permease [Bacteroidia bacterium]